MRSVPILPSLLKHTHSIVIGLTPKLTVNELNPAAEKIFKCKRQAALDKTLTSLCKSADILPLFPKKQQQSLLVKKQINYLSPLKRNMSSFIFWTALRLQEKNNKTVGFLLIGE